MARQRVGRDAWVVAVTDRARSGKLASWRCRIRRPTNPVRFLRISITSTPIKENARQQMGHRSLSRGLLPNFAGGWYSHQAAPYGRQPGKVDAPQSQLISVGQSGDAH